MLRFYSLLFSLLVCAGIGACDLSAQPTPAAAWMDTRLSADQRADLVLKELTLEEKLNLLHDTSGALLGAQGAGTSATQSNGGAEMFGGVPRLNIPAVQMADASYGVTHGRQTGRYAFRVGGSSQDLPLLPPSQCDRVGARKNFTQETRIGDHDG